MERSIRTAVSNAWQPRLRGDYSGAATWDVVVERR